MTKQETHNLATNMWITWPKYIRKRYKNKDTFIEYFAANYTRGWSFLGVSAAEHQKDIAEIKDALTDWTFPNV